MPESLKYEDFPEVLLDYHIEAFRQEYIPGSRVLAREGGKGDEVFFQIAKPVALKLSESNLDSLKKQIHAWWQNKGDDAG